MNAGLSCSCPLLLKMQAACRKAAVASFQERPRRRDAVLRRFRRPYQSSSASACTRNPTGGPAPRRSSRGWRPPDLPASGWSIFFSPPAAGGCSSVRIGATGVQAFIQPRVPPMTRCQRLQQPAHGQVIDRRNRLRQVMAVGSATCGLSSRSPVDYCQPSVQRAMQQRVVLQPPFQCLFAVYVHPVAVIVCA